jgi:hypothetical protein
METDQKRFCVAGEVCFSPASDDGCIILDVRRDSILSLNSTGAFMFAKLAASEEGMTRAELFESIAGEFADVPRVRVEAAVDSLLSQLSERNVIHAPVAAGPTRAWTRNKLSVACVFCLKAVINPLLWMKARTTAALILLTSVDALLKVGGFNTLHELVKRWKLRQFSADAAEMIAGGCATVEKACVWHPKQKLCLQKSAVATCLLRSLGVPAEMVIGVHKMPFYGHSWVEVDGTVVNDHKNVQTFFQVISRC